MMADVRQIMLRHDPGTLSSGGTDVSATLGVDNIRLRAAPIPGDYNDDGMVNAADYGVRTTAYGSTGHNAAGGNGDDVVNAADYTVWRDAASAAQRRRPRAERHSDRFVDTGPTSLRAPLCRNDMR